jgi:DNA mismatch repair protein MutS
LFFLKETQKDVIPNIFQIKLISQKEILSLDYSTISNLELLKNLRDRGKDATLFSIFNHTQTPMGARLLRKIIVEPLTNKNEINLRLDIVQKFKQDVFLRSDLRDKLNQMGDLERIANKINYSRSANGRDLINLRNSLDIIPEVIELLSKGQSSELTNLVSKIDSFSDIRSLISNSITENPPTTVIDGGIIREGYNEKVDEYRNIINNGKKWMLHYEKGIKRRFAMQTGIKVSHNNILGYYIEITNATKSKIKNFPEEFVSRQSIKNAVRYKCKELDEWEQKILEAQEKINDLEHQLFTEIRENIIKRTIKIKNVSETIALIDVLCTFAEIAEKYGYCKPIIKDHDKIIIKEGRHPIVEQINLSEPFIPNDCYLDTNQEQILIITGPNMAGKSTYLRQVALICLIAQMGSFVPAKSAEIGIIDRIFTRIGASDDLARRLSTFMIEMNETAKILNYATSKSLVIIDELGRGTSSSDGGAIAIATLEKLHLMKVKTLFSTHFHQLTEIELPRVKNYHLDILEDEHHNITFIRKVQEGSTDKSYGIHIARLAGIPEECIQRAFEVLEQIEENDPFRETVRNGNNMRKSFEKPQTNLAQKPKKTVQTTFFKPIVRVNNNLNNEFKELVEIINEIDINNITPLEALEKLNDLKKKIDSIDS